MISYAKMTLVEYIQDPSQPPSVHNTRRSFVAGGPSAYVLTREGDVVTITGTHFVVDLPFSAVSEAIRVPRTTTFSALVPVVMPPVEEDEPSAIPEEATVVIGKPKKGKGQK